MTKFLDLTIKINDKDKYKNDLGGSSLIFRDIEPTSLEIKDQDGGNVSELKTHNSSDSVSNVPVCNIKKIKISSSFLDIPISWAWVNKRSTSTTIQFTLKNLKYDEEKGLKKVDANTLLLFEEDFKTEVFKSHGGEFFHSWQSIKLANEGDNEIFYDFSNLWWKITKAGEDEQINHLVPEVEKIIKDTEWNFFYELINVNNNEEEVKKICQDFIREVQELDEWKKIGIKTLLGSRVAKKNGFDLIGSLNLEDEISDGKYYGFPIALGEKYPTLITMTTGFFSTIPSSIFFLVDKNRYTKENIDNFREVFPNDKDEDNPKYFRGFRPGDIIKLGNEFFSAFHQKDIKDKKGRFYEIKNDEKFTRTYYELKSCYESKTNDAGAKQEIREILLRTEAFNEYINKTKKEHWDIYWKWLNDFYVPSFVIKEFGGLHCKLTDLLPLLDKPSYASESKENCKTDLNILKGYESPATNSDEEAIKNRFSSEINAKKVEITNRLKVLLTEAIDEALSEDYGSGQLSPERKKIFTTYRNQIDTFALIDEIKKLIKLLIEGEKLIPAINCLEKMALNNKLKEYQNSQGDKKTAYDLVNRVDNKWVDQTITELEKLTKKDSATLLAERRTQLQAKYDDSIKAQTIFGNNILDSVAALETAEKLLIKVEEAKVQNDTNTSLLKFLQSYQKALEGTLKNKAWQAVNNYNNQAEAAIKHLQKNDQSRQELITAIQEAKNESKLEVAYSQAQNSELYQQGGKSKVIIDNLIQRKRVLFQIEQSTDISPKYKTLLQLILVRLIPDTIKDDEDEQELTWLENQLKPFKTAPESEERGEIYQKYKDVIDQVLTEISQEKQRYQQTQLEVDEEQSTGSDNKQKPRPSRIPKWAWVLIIIGIIVATGSIILVIGRNLRKSSKKSLKLK